MHTLHKQSSSRRHRDEKLFDIKWMDPLKSMMDDAFRFMKGGSSRNNNDWMWGWQSRSSNRRRSSSESSSEESGSRSSERGSRHRGRRRHYKRN